MNTQIHTKSKLLLCLVWLLEGIVVGFGAILPGISGGTLCVAFGMYRPIIETLSDLKTGIKKHWLMLGAFALGIAAGFIGLSGIAAILLKKNTVLVTCAFVGFIIGTFPELWQDAGTQKRTKASFISLGVCFLLMLGILTVLRTQLSFTVSPGFVAYILCGILWGFSFIIPGLSSSSLLLFFDLYQPMLEGISQLDLSVIFPMGIGMATCVLLLSKAMDYAYKKYFSIVSHSVLGIVAATAIMIIPFQVSSFASGIINLFFIIGGAAISYILSLICNKLKLNSEDSEL